MPPRQLVRALREHCALLLCAAAHGFGGYVRGRRPGEITASDAPERRSIFAQGQETRRRRTGGTSSRSRQRIAQKGKPSGHGGCRDFPRTAPPNVALAHAARGRTKMRAMFARNADELAGLHGFE